jgi:hypothetical protein
MLLIRIPPHTVKQTVVAFLVFGETAELFCKIIAHVYLGTEAILFLSGGEYNLVPRANDGSGYEIGGEYCKDVRSRTTNQIA